MHAGLAVWPARGVRVTVAVSIFLLTLPAVVSARFLLTHPESGLYYTHGLLAGGKVQIAGGTEVTGSVHSNGAIHLLRGSVVTGDVSAADKLILQGRVNGATAQGAPRRTLPALASAAELRALANRVLTGPAELRDAVLDGVVLVEGNVTIRGRLSGEGTVIATGVISVEAVAGNPAPPAAADQISLIAFQDILVGQGRALRGVLYAGRDALLEKDLRFEGVVVAGRDLSIAKDSRLRFVDFDQTAPAIELVRPPEGAVLPTAAPEIELRFADDLSGVNLETLRFLLDGADRTGEAAVTVAGLRFAPEPLADGLHAVEVFLADHSAKEAHATFRFTTDTTAPTITARVEPPPNAAGWHRSAATVTFDCADAIGIALCPPPAVVQAEGAGQAVTGTAVDRAGHQASAAVTVNLDATPPGVTIASPADGSTLDGPEVAVSGSISDALSGVADATCNGEPAALSGSGFTCTLSLAPGRAVISIEAIDLAGNSAAASVHVTVVEPQPLAITITAPATGLVTRDDRVTVTGTFTGRASALAVNGVSATLEDGTFMAADIPLTEGTNRLVATAESATGESATASVSVRRDTHPPLIVIETPRDGDRLVSETVTVSGTVNDIIPGATVNADDVTMTINGQPAAVNNRTFMLADLPLAEGLNTITAEAVDRAGNSRSASIRVTREPDLAGIRLVIVEGNNQRALVQTLLPVPLKVRVLAADGQPLAGRPVHFDVDKGDGRLGGAERSVRQATVLTDAAGEASIEFTLGSRTGEGFHRVRATTPGSLVFADFCATGLPAAASKISLARMPPTRGVVGQVVSDPLSVIVTDDGGNAIAGLPVTFQVELGSGSFAGEPSVVVPTDEDGIAEVVFTLGPDAGRANNEVSASFPDNPGLPAIFALSGIAVGPPAETRVSGAVQNAAGEPIVGAVAEVLGTGLTTRTGPDGRFVIDNVPPGGHHIAVHGSAANDPDREIFYPDIDFAMEVVSGADNALGQVVILPFLDMAGAKMVGGDQDVILEMAGVPGFAIKVFAHSTTRPDGTRGPVLMSSSQVNFEKMPMPAPQGATPFVVGTLQPGGVHFDPPAQVIYPNVGGLAPGDVADIFAFHHDIGQYVNVGPGTVSEDGTVVASDPGFGFVQSGWHGLIRIPGPTGQAANGCSVRVEWQIVNADGTLGAKRAGGPVVLPADPPGKAVIRATFSPGGGRFDAQNWTGGAPAVTRSAESAAGTTATVTVTTAAGGAGEVTSPVYRIPVPGKPDKTCQVVIEILAVSVTIEALDKVFAPSVDMLEIKYSIKPSSFTASFAKLEVFRAGNTTTPIFKDETISKAGTNVLYRWEGRANQGTANGGFIGPENSPYTVRITIAGPSEFGAESPSDEKPTAVEVASIELSPADTRALIKPARTATEVDGEIQATVKLRAKDNKEVLTEIPLKVDWSFEDPDDTATSAGIDMNGVKGDDNAPIANGGKRGNGSKLWKPVQGFTTNVAANGQTADSLTATKGNDKGVTKIVFSASKVGGDNYVLVAQVKSASNSVLKDRKTGIWSVRKRLNFTNVYRMNGGHDIGKTMAVSEIDPAFSGDGYTDYTVGPVTGVAAGAGSPLFIVSLLPPLQAELPDAPELRDYASPDPATRNAAAGKISKKAENWYKRNQASVDPAVRVVAKAIGAQARGIVGARYLSEKEDGDPATGQTAFYPAGITIPTPVGPVDPDNDWGETEGYELDGIAWIFLNTTRARIAGRHEAGHASDHEPFGAGDHAATGLMTPLGDGEIFSDDSILRLRGWRP